MNRGLTLMLIIICSIISFAANAAPKTVAIYVDGDITRAQNQIVNSAISERMMQYPSYAIFERNETFINAINQEHDYQLSGEVSLDQIRKIGKKYGVNYVVSVVVVKDQGRTYMTAKIINIESGQIMKQSTLDRPGGDTKELQALANQVIYRILN
ncbi:MAG: hypothetical protein K2G67_02860 [Muribaculaceae bacterium]|nr:hypothetical protein [Muribaculaceae bacterium]